jgi:hypothetical protein
MGKQNAAADAPAAPKSPTGATGKRGKSLKEMRRKVRQQLAPVRKSGRERYPAAGTGPEVDAAMEELDREIGILDPGADREDEDDIDYVQSILGRPGQFSDTWAIVYGHRTIFGNGFHIPCGQANCTHLTRQIMLNSKHVELNAGSTPHGKPRKPPVCHIVSWAALEKEMLDRESRATSQAGSQRLFTDVFRRNVCWYPPNLQPGHNACNAGGTKTTANTVSTREAAAAREIVDKVIIEFNSISIWQ